MNALLDRIEGMYKFTLDKIAPNGFGTKAIIAILILGFAVSRIDPDDLFKLALMAAGAYLAVNAALSSNGNGKT